MEIRGPLSTARLTAEAAVGLTSLKLGAVLNVRVEAELSSQRYLLKLLPGGESLTARTGLELQRGKVVQLEVVRLGKEPELRLSTPAPTPTHAETIPNALLRLLPRQAATADAATPVVALLKASEQLPPGIAQLAKTLLASLPTPAQLSTPDGLKSAVADSGQFFEARLAQALAHGRDFPDADLKGQLLRLVAALAKPNSRPAAEGGAKQTVGNAGQARPSGSQIALSAAVDDLPASAEAPVPAGPRAAASSQLPSNAPLVSDELSAEPTTEVPAQPTRLASQVPGTTVDFANAGASRATPETLMPSERPNSTAEAPVPAGSRASASTQLPSNASLVSAELPAEPTTEVPAQLTRSATQIPGTTVDFANAGASRATPETLMPSERPNSTAEAPLPTGSRAAVSSQLPSNASLVSDELSAEPTTEVPAQPTRSASQVPGTTVDFANAGAARDTPETPVPSERPNSTDQPTPPGVPTQRVEVPETRPQATSLPRPAAEGQSSLTNPALPERESAAPLERPAMPGPNPDGQVLIETPADARLVAAEERAGDAPVADSTRPDELERAPTVGVFAQAGEAAVAKPHDLQTKLEAALARLTVDQLAAQQSPQGLSWRFDLPFLNDDQPGSARLDVHAEDQASGGGAVRRVWSVNLELEPPGLGRFVARILWDGEKVDSYLWSDRDATGDLIKTHAEHLRARLEEAGLKVGRLEQPVQRPESQQPSRPRQPLLDLTA